CRRLARDPERFLQLAFGLEQVERSRAVRIAPQQALLLEIADVLVNGGKGTQSQALADLFVRRAVTVLLRDSADEVVHLALLFCYRHTPFFRRAVSGNKRRMASFSESLPAEQGNYLITMFSGVTKGQCLGKDNLYQKHHFSRLYR